MLLLLRKQLTTNFLELQRINIQQTLHQGANSQRFHRGSFQFRSLATESKGKRLNDSTVDYFKKL